MVEWRCGYFNRRWMILTSCVFSTFLREWFTQQSTLRRNWNRKWSCHKPLEETWYMIQQAVFRLADRIFLHFNTSLCIIIQRNHIFVTVMLVLSLTEQGHHALRAGDCWTLTWCRDGCYPIFPTETPVPYTPVLLLLPTWRPSQVSWAWKTRLL